MLKVPRWLYNTQDRAAIFNTQEDIDAAIAEGWKESPADVVAQEVDEKSALIAEAEALGIDVDKRWGVQKLKDVIAAAKVEVIEE